MLNCVGSCMQTHATIGWELLVQHMLNGVGSCMQTNATTGREFLVQQMLNGVGSCMQTDLTTCWELLVLQMLNGVGSCVQTYANNFQRFKDVQCILGRIRPIRLCKTYKIRLPSCFQHVNGLETICDAHAQPQQCWKCFATDPTLLLYTLRRSRNKRNVGS